MTEILTELGGVLAIAVMAARFFAKLIPDSAGGAMGLLRQILKILGAYTENVK